jgi:23S rRNA (pseudouridine1915-N3)-methyltransferase
VGYGPAKRTPGRLGALKLGILAVGRMKAGPERELLRRYLERSEALGRSLGFGPLQLHELDESRARTPEARKREEAAELKTHLPAGADLIVLDERGTDLSSEAFAEMLAKARDSAVPVLTFAVGGPDGFDPEFRRHYRAIAFGRATFPHQFVRVMLAEQIYRALTILAGHPYHRA